MFLHASAAIIVVVPLLPPLAREMGIDPVHFGDRLPEPGHRPADAAGGLRPADGLPATGLRIEQVIGYGKWFILTMFAVLMLVSFVPATAIWFK